METTIFYFSSTGNCLEVARIMADKLSCDIMPITQWMNLLSGGEQAEDRCISCASQRIGFVFPTYFWGLPELVERFVKTLKIEHKKPYLFAVTCAVASGGSLGSLDVLLKEKGYVLDYGKVIHSVSNYIVEYNINVKTKEKVLAGARKEAEKAAEDVHIGKRNQSRKIWLLTDRFHKMYTSNLGEFHRGFCVTDSCVSCGICSQICPVGNIKMVEGRPVFSNHCQSCIACIHWCPQEAIQYKDKTQKHHRYHNPSVDRADLNHYASAGNMRE